LQMMNDQLDWTQRLGDAFLDQQEQVMDTVQQFRRRAQAQGSLRSTNEQRVFVDPQTQEIIVEPVAPQVVYVPVYDPMIVYGPWWWPAYRPYYYRPRGAVIAGGIIGFGVGVAIGVAWGYAWGGFDWHRHDVGINVTRNVNINNRIDRNRYASRVTAGSGGQGMWTHDPDHRRGVAYRAPAVAQQYGRGPRPGADVRRDYRGFEPNRPPAQQVRTAPGPNQARPEPPRQPSAPAQQPRVQAGPGQPRPEVGRQPPAAVQQPRATESRPVARPEPPRQPQAPAQQAVIRPEPPRQPPAPGRQAVQGVQGPTAFGGVGPASQTRQLSNRGHESLSSARSASPAPNAVRTPPSSAGQGGGASRGGSPRTSPGGGSPGAPHGGGQRK
jgi:hypothetical protein